jgi:hypothetical protein
MKQPIDLTPKFPLLSAEEEIYIAPNFADTPSQMVGGWRADANQLSQGNVQLQSNQERFLIGNATGSLTGIGIFLGKDGTDYEFRAGDPSAQYIHWDGSTLAIRGSVTATSGTIGGWAIGATTLTGGNTTLDSTGVLTLGTSNDVVKLSSVDASYRLWIGNATAASAPFRVTKAGVITAADITITGGSVASSTLNGLIAQANLSVSNRGWTQTSAFSVTDADTVAWAAGTFTSADGTAYSIGAGNTGNMAARTYIYLDNAISTTAYQTTTTPANAVGAGRVLIATAVNGTAEAEFEVFGGIGGSNINASQIVASSITANEIAGSTITAAKLSVAQLSAITADLGSITAGTVTLASSGHIKSGQTDYNTGTGFWLGISSGTAKFSIGNSAGNYITWDGSALTINGYLTDQFQAGSILIASADTNRSTTSTSATKLKEIRNLRRGRQQDRVFAGLSQWRRRRNATLNHIW